jgi:hypothetical protein
LNPFEWTDVRDGFGTVLAGGKFEAVIGNPPYIRIQQLKEWSPTEAAYVQAQYRTARVGNVDIYIPFIEKGLELLREDGVLGFIVSHKFLQARYGARLRDLVSRGQLLRELVSFGHQQVFDGPTTYTCLIFLSPTRQQGFRYAEFSKLSDITTQLRDLKGRGTQGVGWTASSLPNLPPGDAPWSSSLHPASGALESRLLSKWPRLHKVAKVFRGGQTSADNVFLLELASPAASDTFSKEAVKVRVEGTERVFSLETEFLKPLVKSGEMHRFHLSPPKRALLFPYKIVDGRAVLIDFAEIEQRARKTAEYLESRRRELQGRKGARKWWAYGYPKNLTEFEAPKLMTRDLAPAAWFCYDKGGGMYFPGGAAGGYGIRPTEGLDPRYLLGLLNSRLLDSLLRARTTVFRNGWYSYEYRFIKDLPIRTVAPGDSESERLRDEIISRVDRLLALWPRMVGLPPSAERERIEREVRSNEGEVDGRVERLYGVSPEDLKLLGLTAAGIGPSR